MDNTKPVYLLSCNNPQQHSNCYNAAKNGQIEEKMRILANYLIDQVLDIQKIAQKKGLNINEEKNTLIMEQLIKSLWS